MTNFIDLIYCSDLNGMPVLASAPMSEFIKKGDIVCVDELKGFYLVTYQVTVSKDSDTYNFITGAFGRQPYKVTDKYSHQEIGGTENE